MTWSRRDLHAQHVIVATGGFQSNLKTVLENWPSELPRPVRLLAGAAYSATGSGLDLVRRVNGRVGEVTGFAGINGKAALEGTFLGPGIYMGRIAGRSIARQLTPRTRSEASPEPRPLAGSTAAATFADAECLKCHNVAKDVARARAGYWHYEQSHAKVLARGYMCSSCHGEMYPYRRAAHQLNRTAIVAACRACHGVQPRDARPVWPQ